MTSWKEASWKLTIKPMNQRDTFFAGQVPVADFLRCV